MAEGIHHAHAEVTIEIIIAGEYGYFIFFNDLAVLVIRSGHAHAQFFGFIST